jgi:hypothetical protein
MEPETLAGACDDQDGGNSCPLRGDDHADKSDGNACLDVRSGGGLRTVVTGRL